MANFWQQSTFKKIQFEHSVSDNGKKTCEAVELPVADKSLARPGRKQARKHVRDARDFNNIETRTVIKFFFFLQGKAPKEIHAILTESLACILPGRAKNLSAPPVHTYIHLLCVCVCVCVCVTFTAYIKGVQIPGASSLG